MKEVSTSRASWISRLPVVLRPLAARAPLALIAPFYINDFGFWALQANPLAFYLFDYSCRLLVIAIAGAGVLLQHWRPEQLHWRKLSWRSFALWSIGLSAIGTAQEVWFDPWLERVTGKLSLFKFPDPTSAALKIFDQSVGLGLVAFSEETVFRGFVLTTLITAGTPRLRAALLSSVLFATMHWGTGPTSVLCAWIWCLLPTLSVLITRSLWPAVVAHFVSDFVAFW